MTITFKALSALLSYPTADLQAAVPEMVLSMDAERLIPRAQKAALQALLEDLRSGDLYDLQERYVLLFDRTRSLSLHLFEHVHGESRDRGQAMVDLQQLYADHGLMIGASELPDFLPMFLEFLALRPRSHAYELLGQTSHILAAIAERLRKREAPYEVIFRILVDLAATRPKGEDIAAVLQAPDFDANDLPALDAVWEDEPVHFGPGATDSCKDELIARIRAARRPAQDPPPAARNSATPHR